MIRSIVPWPVGLLGMSLPSEIWRLWDCRREVYIFPIFCFGTWRKVSARTLFWCFDVFRSTYSTL
jgi:hypothetical protein